MSIHVSYNQPDNEIHSYDGKPSAVVTGAGPAVIEIHMTAGEWDAANRLYYRQEATGVDGFVQASESNNQQFLLPCAYLASGELQIALNNPEQGLTTNLMKISITKMSSSGDLSDDDPQFTIDGKKRLVLVPGSQGILAVQFDNESESVTFKFPRYQDGVDLSTKTPYVNYRLPNSGELGKSLCSIDTDMLTAEYIYFSWTIDINVTMFEGSIKFQVEFSDSQGYRWQSQIAELPILTSLYNTGLEPYSPSFLEEALRQMQQYSSDAEAFAVGTRNGVPVAQGDPAYENNAKYYAQWFFESGVSFEAKQALLNLVSHIGWDNIQNGQQYIDKLETELFRTAKAIRISAVFDPGEDVIYDSADLESLRQYLTVTAEYEDFTTGEITGYTLDGILSVGTSTIQVQYGTLTTTFDVVVSSYWDFEWDYTQGKLEDRDEASLTITNTAATSLESNGEKLTAANPGQARIQFTSGFGVMQNHKGVLEVTFVLNIASSSNPALKLGIAKGPADGASSGIFVTTQTIKLYYNKNGTNTQAAALQNNVEYTVRLVLNGSIGYVYLNGEKIATVDNTDATLYAGSNYIAVEKIGATNYYVLLKSVKLKNGGI